MNKPAIGMVVGGLLGVLDGLSAWFSPDARPMMPAIVLGSTLKGVLTGVAAGLVARRLDSLAAGVAVGVFVGFALSVLVARGQAGHFWDIVLPGMLLGAVTGYATQRYPRALVLLFVLAPTVFANAQTPAAADPLASLDFLIGRWATSSSGEPGTGTGEREYSTTLGGRFIQGRNRIVYPPQEKNPKGETHEDRSMFSFDRTRKRLVLRQFHVEGFVNQYIAEPPATAGVVVFTTEAIENIPAGWRARETYTRRGADEVEEVFELAEPGKEFVVYSRTQLKRVR